MNESIEKIEKYIHENNIKIDKCENLKRFNKAALYCNINHNSVILLNTDFDNRDINERLEILVEECGHHATSSGDIFKKNITFFDKIKHDKIEKKAEIWGANFLIELSDIKKYLLISNSVEELTQYLGVSERILYSWLYDKKDKQQYLQLSESKLLDLYKLPNIVILDRDGE